MTVYYNDADPFAAAWLRQLILAGLLPSGDVDERSIEEVTPDDVRGYTAVHLFAGIGGWAYALHLAGWPADESVWTGSCPCQPFSVAGRAGGVGDARHLWPAFRGLVAECRPPVVFGEQVAGRCGRYWLAGVRGDLEDLGYAVGAADLCAASVGAPQIRSRLWWVGDAGLRRSGGPPRPTRPGPTPLGPAEAAEARSGGPVDDWRLARANGVGRLGSGVHLRPARPDQATPHQPWAGAEWCDYIDGLARRLQPGLEPLVAGFPGRLGRVRAYGNAIVPQVGAAFVRAYRATLTLEP